ncbi:MAG: globin family protein [Pseudomonadota bacterium]
MTPRQISLVQESFKTLVPSADDVAELFYARLFELDPALRPMFSSDLTEQGKKLVVMLDVAVKGLSQLDALVPQVMALGRRHRGYGVQAEHYDTVGSALLWTLDQGLGPAFTREVEEAWTAAYGLLAQTMITGAEDLAA